MLLQRLRALDPDLLRGIRRGIEKESLRVRADGTLASTPHPAGLGSPLTHPHITTDFSESQLELITGVHTGVEGCLDQLAEIHQAVFRELGDELLWGASMPCGLPADDAIPIARYGSSNIGRAKTVYRNGLAHRYGRRMQTISGIHYNFSIPDAAWPLLQRTDARSGPEQAYRDEAYFGLIRNFRRHSWLLLYLFGASPAVCESFVEGRAHRLETLAAGTVHLPHATSLRMGPLGYQSDAQSSLAVSYNSLASYASSLHEALNVPYPRYAAIGVRDDGADYRQLSTTLLQIENEFYGTIRPKRRTRKGERPLHALRERGVEYAEVRCLDLDPFCPVGITAATIRFLDVFLLHCLLADSAPDTPGEISAVGRNQHRVAERGREPGLKLDARGAERTPAEWGGEILAECEPIAAALDSAHGGRAYRDALGAAGGALRDPELTPSARMLREIQAGEGSYVRFVLARLQAHRRHLQSLPFPQEAAARYTRLAAESLASQRQTEVADKVPYEVFRRQYLALPE